MHTELIEKKITEGTATAHIYLTFFSQDKIDVNVHLLYDLKDEKQRANFEKASQFFKVGKIYTSIFKEKEAEAEAAAPKEEKKEG